jgi:hypothetical protein
MALAKTLQIPVESSIARASTLAMAAEARNTHAS